MQTHCVAYQDKPPRFYFCVDEEGDIQEVARIMLANGAKLFSLYHEISGQPVAGYVGKDLADKKTLEGAQRQMLNSNPGDPIVMRRSTHLF